MDELQKAVEAKLLKEILEESDKHSRDKLIDSYRVFAQAVQMAQSVKH